MLDENTPDVQSGEADGFAQQPTESTRKMGSRLPQVKPRRNDRSRAIGPVLDRNKPVEIAEAFVENFGERRLVRWREDFYTWELTHYHRLDDEEVRTKVYSFLKYALVAVAIQEPDPNDARKKISNTVHLPFDPETRIVNKVVDALKHYARIRISNELEAPCWLSSVPDVLTTTDLELVHTPKATDLFACKNGLVNLVTGKKFGHRPDFFNLNAADVDYDPKAEATCERWVTFLDDILPGDTEAQETVEEMLAYTLAGDRSYQKIFLLVGAPRAGKGTIARLLTALLGAANVKSPTCESLAGPFGLAPLIGMKAAIIPDARLEGRGTHVLVERQLSISGQDAISVNRKGKTHWDGVLGTQLWMLSNTFPGFSDASAVIATRFVPVWLRKSWLGKEDIALTETLLGELPGILKRLMVALDRLRKRGKFIVPKSARRVVDIMEDEASPLRAFVRECCELSPEYGENCDDRVYPVYRQWCVENSHRAMSKTKFRHKLMEAEHSVDVHRPGSKGAQHWSCKGLKLSSYGLQLYIVTTVGKENYEAGTRSGTAVYAT